MLLQCVTPNDGRSDSKMEEVMLSSFANDVTVIVRRNALFT